MKIYVNGTVRDMTAEEIAEMQQYQLAEQQRLPDALSDNGKIQLMLEAVPTEPTPTMPPKVGYKWQAIYSSAAGFAWELVEDPDAVGTLANPLRWVSGLAVQTGLNYTDGVKKYLALADGVPTGFDDAQYFVEV